MRCTKVAVANPAKANRIGSAPSRRSSDESGKESITLMAAYSGIHREFWMDLTAPFAVNLSIIGPACGWLSSGGRSIPRTYAGARE